MIAYGYNIKCSGVLEEHQKEEESSSHSIVVTKASSSNMKETMRYKLSFHNNQGRDLTLYTDRIFACTQKEQLWLFEVKDVVTLFWYSGRENVKYIAHENFTDELLKYWCLHIFLPTFFTIEEKYDFLHAGAVEVDGKPILFIAESFGGKSTMTDFFMKQGHVMVSDDKVASYESEGTFFAVPSHPHHRPHRKMEDLGFYVENTAKTPKPIHAIYELEKAEADDPIAITKLFGVEKFKSLRYRSELNLSFLKSKRFTFISRLAKAVPVYKVTVPWDLERLPEVYRKIVEHCTR